MRAPERPGHRRALPLGVVAGVLCGGCVLVTSLLTALLSSALGPSRAWAVGTAVGLALCAGIAVLASHLGRVLRQLQREARRRLQDPRATAARPPRRAALLGREVAALAGVVEAMQVRVRLADEMAARHQREAQQSGAGVFELLCGLTAAEEGARGQLAAELHDTVAQSLGMARRLVHEHVGDCAGLVAVGDHVEDAEEQLRAVMARTRPPALRDGDLAQAVSAMRDDLRLRYAVEVELTWPQQAHELALATAVTVYRFVQEGLLNVVKHADVDSARVSLTVSATEVVVVVADDGPGFDPAAVRSVGGRQVGLGLLGERARLAGGRVDVMSGAGAGTTLRLALPRGSRRRPQPESAESDVHAEGNRADAGGRVVLAGAPAVAAARSTASRARHAVSEPDKG